MRPIIGIYGPCLVPCFILAGLFLQGCGSKEKAPASNLKPGITVELKGIVKEIDASAMPRDGAGILVLETTEYGEVRVTIPSGESRPQASGLDWIHKLKPGEQVKVCGKVGEGNQVGVFDAGHYLKGPE